MTEIVEMIQCLYIPTGKYICNELFSYLNILLLKYMVSCDFVDDLGYPYHLQFMV